MDYFCHCQIQNIYLRFCVVSSNGNETIPDDAICYGTNWGYLLTKDGVMTTYQSVTLLKDGTETNPPVRAIREVVGNKMTLLQSMKPITRFDSNRLRTLFKRLYYDEIYKFISNLRTGQYQLLFLKNDIKWINENLGLSTSFQINWQSFNSENEDAFIQQFPLWYDGLLEDSNRPEGNQKDYFLSEMSYDSTTGVYVQDIGLVLNKSTVNTLINLKNENNTNFDKQYRLLLNKVQAELLCVCVDHKMQFWYRPFTEDLECNTEHAFWCDPDAISVSYKLNNGSNIDSASLSNFLLSLENISVNFSSLYLYYNGLSTDPLYSELNQTTEYWITSLKNFVEIINNYVGNSYKRILNMKCENLDSIYNAIWMDTLTHEGIMTWITSCLANTYENPWQETDGLLVANGILSPRWQIIYDCFNAIVTERNEENGVLYKVYYPNVDFETLLKSENAADKIAQAVWRPWSYLNEMFNNNDNIYSLIEMKTVSYNLINTTNGTCLYPVDTSEMTEEEKAQYYVPVPGDDQHWTRDNYPKNIYQTYCTEYLNFYKKYPYFNTPELKCLFWDTLYSLYPIPWVYYTDENSTLVALCGDLQIWQRFLVVDPTIPTDEVSTKGSYTTVWEQIANNYESLSYDSSPVNQYWCTQKDS